jgi:hypothetical protein
MYELILSAMRALAGTPIALARQAAETLRNDANDLRAGCVAALAGNFHFVGACVLAPVAAKFLARRYIAVAGFVGALVLFLVHVLLLKSTR